MTNKICPRCNTSHYKPGTYCSRSCANSRGPRTDDFKRKVSAKLTGVPCNRANLDGRRKSFIARGIVPRNERPNSLCKICDKDTGTLHRKTCSEECYSKLATIQSQSHPNCGGQKHTHRSKIYNIHNEEFLSESSYEQKLARILNDLGIYWNRPSFFWYKDSHDRSRRYYPDFYLPDFDIYLDPKNEYLIKTDIDKIIRASRQNDIYVVVLGIDYLNSDCIVRLVGDRGNAPLLPVCRTGTLLLS